MANKKYKFSVLKNIYQFLNSNESKILLIAQYNNYNKITNLKSLETNFNFKSLKINTKLFNKITNNPFLTSLYQSNTILYVFSDMKDLQSFTKDKIVKNKIVPLSIFWKNKLYSYNFIEKTIFFDMQVKKILYGDCETKLLFQLKEPILSVLKLKNNNIISLLKLLKLREVKT